MIGFRRSKSPQLYQWGCARKTPPARYTRIQGTMDCLRSDSLFDAAINERYPIS